MTPINPEINQTVEANHLDLPQLEPKADASIPKEEYD